MTDSALEPLTAVCQGSGCASRYHVGWCPAWNVWLCTECRWRRCESELRIPLEARRAMEAADREAAGG